MKASGKIIIETFAGEDVPSIKFFGEVDPKDIQMLLPSIRRSYFGEYLDAIAKEEVAALADAAAEEARILAENKEAENKETEA